MTATLPPELCTVFEGATRVELVTLDGHGLPVVSSVPPSYAGRGAPCIDVPRRDVADPHVALLFAQGDPMVLVQGTAHAADVLHVLPERVYVWASGAGAEPQLFDAHMEEVRSGHNEEPEVGHASPEGGDGLWDDRLDALTDGVLACVAPDGFPFAVRLAVRADRDGGVLRFPEIPLGTPIEPGRGCVHSATGARVHGDLAATAAGWQLVPHAVLAAG